VNVDHSLLAALKEIALAAHGSLAVAQCHLQLAKQRVKPDDRIAHDHLDTAIVFTDSATAVIATINEVMHRVEQKIEGERAAELKFRTA
jgi:predicted proteasome-type protease